MKTLTAILLSLAIFGCNQNPSSCNVSIVRSYTNGTNLFVQLNNGQTLYAGETTTTHMYYNEEAQRSPNMITDAPPPLAVNDSTKFRNNDLVGIWRKYSKGVGQNERIQRDNFYLTIKSDGTFNLTNPDQHSGQWFTNEGWIEGKKMSILNLMKHTYQERYDQASRSYIADWALYGDCSFEPMIYLFKDVNGTKQLVLMNIGGKYGFEISTYIKQ